MSKYRISPALLLVFAAMPFSAEAAANLKWDLSYQEVMNTHQVAGNEFLRVWVARFPPRRLIQEALDEYAGEAIEASALIEYPDGDAGAPMALWLIRTRSGATLCDVYSRKAQTSCEPADPAKADRYLREVAALSAPSEMVSERNVVGMGPDGQPMVVNYVGFLSIYLDGQTQQRPLRSLELADLSETPPAQAAISPKVGQVRGAIFRLVLSDKRYQEYLDRIEAMRRR